MTAYPKARFIAADAGGSLYLGGPDQGAGFLGQRRLRSRQYVAALGRSGSAALLEAGSVHPLEHLVVTVYRRGVVAGHRTPPEGCP